MQGRSMGFGEVEGLETPRPPTFFEKEDKDEKERKKEKERRAPDH